jgi:hypothetical protein
MPGVDDIDITTDLHSRGDGVPADHGAVDVNRGVVEQPTVLPEGEKEAPAPSLRDTLTDAFKGTEAPKADGPPPSAPVVPDPNAPQLVKVGDRWHRKDGSFASNEDIAAFNAAQTGQPAPPVIPPWAAGLTELEKQQFTALPAETRQWIERTMDGVMQRTAQFGEYDTIEQVIGPRRQAWADNGMPPAVALQQLFALSDFAGRDPGQFTLWFADQHKIDLDAILDERDAAAQGKPQSDPAFIGLQQEIAQLRNTIHGFTTNTSQQQQAANMRLVQEFTDEKDAQGNPLRPYFGEVASEIAQHVTLIRQQQPYLPERDVLQAAYDFATFNNPTIRDRIQQETLKATQNSAVAEAQRARNVAVSINGGPAADAGAQPTNANRTLREELIHAYNQSVAQ